MIIKRTMINVDIESVKYAVSGDIVVSSKNEYIVSSPLGSCVAVVVYDTENSIGGMAHIMLPGKSSREDKSDKNKYAIDAISELLRRMDDLGAHIDATKVCLVGGANVLRKKGDTIAEAVIKSVDEIIQEKKLTIVASSLGGFERRSVSINMQTGIVSFTIGDGNEKILWNFNK